MAIPAKETKTIPAVSEQNASGAWFNVLKIFSQPESANGVVESIPLNGNGTPKGKAIVVHRNFNPDTGQVAEGEHTLTVPLDAAMEGVPSFAAAIQALMASYPEVETWYQEVYLPSIEQ